jgi:ribosomal-protein-alanine N-acetyltransferase
MIPETQRLPILETERLRLAPLTIDDAEQVFPLMDDPEVMAYWDSPEVDDPDLVAEIVARQVAQMEDGLATYWSIRSLEDGVFIGVCDISEIDWRHKRAELAFMLDPETSGQGFGLEAMRAVVVHAASTGLSKLTSRTHLGNRRSETLLEKLGFTQEGLLRGHAVHKGQRRDYRLYGLLL